MHKYSKRSQPCRICQDVLNIERYLQVDEVDTISKFKLLELSDLGSLKYPSEVVLESVHCLEDLYLHVENDWMNSCKEVHEISDWKSNLLETLRRRSDSKI